jgi:predicted ABC-type transport system involved in lysophospholipase L1 biosynthesis ATPase subunit
MLSSSDSDPPPQTEPRERSRPDRRPPPAARPLAAYAGRPSPTRILLADEPTGQLDSETGHMIMLLLREVVRTEGVTAIVATHDPVMLDVADRIVELRDGELFE